MRVTKRANTGPRARRKRDELRCALVERKKIVIVTLIRKQCKVHEENAMFTSYNQ